MNVNKVVAAVGGLAVGVGGTLLTQKLRKDARESGLLDAIEETVTEVKAAVAETKAEPAENLAYREATATKLTAARPVKNVPATPIKKSEPQAEKNAS